MYMEKLANLHNGHVGRTPAVFANIVYIGKINKNQIVVSMYKHKKPASQYYVPIDPICPNLVSLIQSSEFFFNL